MSAITRALTALSRRSAFSALFSRSFTALSPKVLPALSINQNQFQVRQFSATKAEQDLQEFLSQEIKVEKESAKSLPKIDGWKVSHDGSEITLSKVYDSEEITIKANTCYAVEEDGDEENEQENTPSMVCKPDFAIEIRKGSQILGLNCTFFREEDEGNARTDDIQINEISIYEGEFQKNNYAISGDVIDGTLYDMLMNILEERGIDQEFSKKFIDYATAYEHKQYVGLLAQLQKFFA